MRCGASLPAAMAFLAVVSNLRLITGGTQVELPSLFHSMSCVFLKDATRVADGGTNRIFRHFDLIQEKKFVRVR